MNNALLCSKYVHQGTKITYIRWATIKIWKIKQVAAASFGGPLWDISKLEKVQDTNRQRTHTHNEKEITEAPLITLPIDHWERANTCLLNLTLNEISSSHSLQFASKYHVSLDSLWPQIWEHTHRSLGLVALYYTGVELEKNVTQL